MDNATFFRLTTIPGWVTLCEETFGPGPYEQYHERLLENEHRGLVWFYGEERERMAKHRKEWRIEMADFEKECKQRIHKEREELLEQAKQNLAGMMRTRGNVEKKRRLLTAIKKYEAILKDEITPEKIERAREYPIERLIEVKNGMARCLSHEDHRPSMNCKRNFCYCHACGFHADAIKVYQVIHNCSFAEAVNALCL